MTLQAVQVVFTLAMLICLVRADIEVDIDEELSPGSFLTDLNDHAAIFNSLDPSQRPLMTYAILDQNNPPANFFTVDTQSGVMTIARKMNREAICDPTDRCEIQFNMAIRAGPGANVAFSNVITVKVVVNDINDNAPRFPARDVTLEISEGAKVGTELKISGAVDLDSKPEFTVQHYNSTPILREFSIHPITNPDGSSTINLRLERELDRELAPSYVFNIVAYDGGRQPQSDYLRVTILVGDDNDNSPEFDKKEYQLAINEDEKLGASVGQVTASDKDDGDFGRITYGFSVASEGAIKGVFSINATTGVIYLEGDLDSIRRSPPPFFMYVDARDGGEPPRSSQTLVSVTVLDSGNNAPYVRVNTVTAGDASTLTIPESAGLEYFVAFVNVADHDDGENGQFQCNLLSGDDFKLSPVPGKGYTLLLNTAVDRETKESYQILINCKDGGTPPLDTSVALTVNISDVNDNDPKFQNVLYTTSVDENRPAGQFVAQVSAEDADDGLNAHISYSLPKEAGEFIQIQSRTGTISTTAPLDREKNATLRFKIYASDAGSEVRTGVADLIITVNDVNDNKPTFNQTKFSFFIAESTPNKTQVGILEAYDLDIGANGQFDFYFGGSTNGDMPLPFTVLKNGSLRVSGLVDRETKPYYSFTVLVRDRGEFPKSNAVPVEVNVIDENDNDPVILFPTTNNHTIVISTYPENGMVLGRIIAYDVDEGDSSTLKYSIYQGNEDDAFDIDPTNGELVVKDIRRMRNPEEYFLSIKVIDSSDAPRNATTQLRIEVNYANRTDELAGDLEERPREQYVVIVGVIGGATIVLSVIIISAIIIILRSEKNKRGPGNGSLFKNKFFNGPSSSSSSSSSEPSKPTETSDTTKAPSSHAPVPDPNGLILNSGNTGKKPEDAQKKVSFSLDVQDPVQGQGNNTMADKQLRLALPPHIESSGQWKKLNSPDDINSDTSGESGTCDSGRGTSDEDIKFEISPVRGPPMLGPHTDPFQPARERGLDQYMPQSAMNIRGVPSLQGHAQSRKHTPTPPPIKSGQPRFLEVGGTRQGGAPVGDGRSSCHSLRPRPSSTTPPSVVSSSLRHPPTNHHHHHQQLQQQHRVPHGHKDLSGSDNFRPSSSLGYYTQQGSALSMDDDASTTTSGSYVINPDDLRLDGFLSKDVIV